MIKGTIKLSGMQFHAFHGCFDFERAEGGEFIVDFAAELDIARAAESDSLEDTVDYGAIYELISREMDIPSNLLEHVAVRIANAVKKEFPELLSVTLTITKLTPPVPGPVDSSSVTVTL
ncbi:MAG: dihydroneopterin aldolase [Bacteroidales bacterium]|nr:dihydroneopterin aldolase [Bacteroidales bacterium]